jgi:organic radical activating enzyme
VSTFPEKTFPSPAVGPTQFVNAMDTKLEYTLLDDELPYTASIGLFLTKRCPLRCSHCIVDSSPENEDPSWDEVISWTEKLGASSKLSHVCITGGEPFLRLELLREVVEILTKAKKSISIITSGYWATSSQNAKALVSEAFGEIRIYRLWLSLDSYHSRFVPAERYSYVIEAARHFAIPICVTATYRNEAAEAISFVERAIPSVEIRSQIEKLRPQPLFRLGRANTISIPNSQTNTLPVGSCGSCNGHINARGESIACCSVFDAKENSPLHLGTLDLFSVDELLEKSSRDWLIQAIRTLGPKRLAEIAAGFVPREVFSRSYLPHDICAVCSEIMASDEAVKYLRSFLAEGDLRKQIALLRAAIYNELESVNYLYEEEQSGSDHKAPDRESNTRSQLQETTSS